MIYIVNSESGTHDYHSKSIEGVYTDKPQAEKLKNKLINKAKNIFNNSPHYDETGESYEYEKYWSDNEKYLDSYNVWIDEIPSNKEIINNELPNSLVEFFENGIVCYSIFCNDKSMDDSAKIGFFIDTIKGSNNIHIRSNDFVQIKNNVDSKILMVQLLESERGSYIMFDVSYL
jgi:hypothetical protein